MSTFDSLYKEIKNIFGEENITIQRIIVLTPKIITFVQEMGTIKHMNGQEKKELFFEVIKKLIEESKLSDEEREGIQDFVKITLPIIVDVIVFAYKSEIFKKIKKKTKKCFASCC